MLTTPKSYEHYRNKGSTNRISPNTTEVLRGAENAVGRGVHFMKNVKIKMDICFDHRAPSIVTEVPAYRDGYLDIRSRGGKIRCFTEITKENLHYCKRLLELVDELRHLEGAKGGIAISETEFMATTVLEEAKPLAEVIYSNVREVVEQGQYIFDILWSKAIPAEDRIKQIEEGIEPEIIETIRDPKRVLELVLQLVNSARQEILIIFSTANAFHRQERAGSLQLLRKATSRGVNVKILTPVDDKIKSVIEREEELLRLQKQEQDHRRQPILNIRDIETSSLQTKISLLVVDSAFSLAVELKDNTKESSLDAIGLATYSNSKPTVQSYVAFFESLWILTESYRLMKLHDKLQREFINIAAHELRTPIQPIVGLTEVLREGGDQLDIERQKQLLDAISRNASRLNKLSEDLLDVTRIESQTLNLYKQKINLRELVADIIKDLVPCQIGEFKPSYKASLQKQTSGSRQPSLPVLLFECKEDNVYVMGDSARLTQVICNVLANAIEFSSKPGGVISVILKKENDGDYGKCAIVSIKDNGSGIDIDVLPRLFSKFATKSEKGMGLGLFISKSIVEAHGGQMWAENNQDGNGATFTFLLPLLGP